MVRLAMLRGGYAALGLAFAALAVSFWVGGLELAAIGIGFLAGILLALSGDHLPKWAGLALVAYFVLIALALILTTSVTIHPSGGSSSYFFGPPDLYGVVNYWIGLTAPIMLAGAAAAAVAERERAPKILVVGALAGLALVAVLSAVLTPQGNGVQAAQQSAQSQAQLVGILRALSAGAGAVGTLWCAARADDL